MQNFRITESYKLQKRCGYRKVCTAPATIRGIWYGVFQSQSALFLVSTTHLYRYNSLKNTFTSIGTLSTSSGKVSFFSYNSNLYLLDGTDYLCYDGTKVSPVEGYIPTVLSNADPNTGQGILLEHRNMLTNKAYAFFTPIPNVTSYYFPFQGTISSIKVNGVRTTAYSISFDHASQCQRITFSSSPASTSPNGIEILFNFPDTGLRQKICSCRFAAAYSGEGTNKLFFFGGSSSNCLYCSNLPDSVHSADFFSAQAILQAGDNSSKVTSAICNYDRLMVFTETSTWYTYCKISRENNVTRPTFPLYALNSTIGNLGNTSAGSFENTPLSLTGSGVYQWIFSGYQDRRNAKCISKRIESVLSSDFLQRARTFTYPRYNEFWIACDDTVWVYNYQLDIWYFFDDIPADDFFMMDGSAAFYKNADLYLFDEAYYSDDSRPYTALWESGYLDFGFPQHTKDFYRFFIALKPEQGGRVVIEMKPDSGQIHRLGDNFELYCPLFSFDYFDFSKMNFSTDTIPHTFRQRFSIRGCTYMKLTLSNEDVNGHATIMSLRLDGVVRKETH